MLVKQHLPYKRGVERSREVHIGLFMSMAGKMSSAQGLQGPRRNGQTLLLWKALWSPWLKNRDVQPPSTSAFPFLLRTECREGKNSTATHCGDICGRSVKVGVNRNFCKGSIRSGRRRAIHWQACWDPTACWLKHCKHVPTASQATWVAKTKAAPHGRLKLEGGDIKNRSGAIRHLGKQREDPDTN